MTRVKSRLVQIALATAAGAGCLFVSEKISLHNPQSLVTEAHAVIGRPLTPMSYAGVARRTTRRAVYGTAAVAGAYAYHPPVYGAPVYAAPVGVAPACYQSVDPYGRIYMVCP
jgi:hypothetical protein